MTEEFEVVYEARLNYQPEEEITEEAAKQNLIDLIRRQPNFGNIRVEYPNEDEA